MRVLRSGECKIARQIGDQPRAVGVVAEQSFVLRRERIHRTGDLRARRSVRVEETSGLLVRHSDVQPLAAGAKNAATSSLRFFWRRLPGASSVMRWPVCFANMP